MVAYREKNLYESVQDCLKKAKYPHRISFSVVSEQESEDLHANLRDFVSKDKIIYRKYNLSTYRGVLWSRNKTTQVSPTYDYILYTCGHNIFAPNWDEIVLQEYEKASKHSEKAIITVSGPEYEFDESGNITYNSRAGRLKNFYRPRINSDYIPGYGFPKVEPVPDTDDVLEDCYWQGSWVFSTSKYVEEVPIDPDMNYHGEEIYLTLQSWARGWRFYATPKILYYHDTYKEYPGEELPRTVSHRPWADLNKDAFWDQSDESMKKLNMLLSGNLKGVYGNIPKEKILEYCKKYGLNPQWCEYDENYHKLNAHRHGQEFRHMPPITT
jgi:hypothetical protein